MTDRRNIVLVTVDSLRADHCEFMGYEKDTTPTLDAMAEEGVAFENAIAPGPKTPEAMPAIFTGCHPPLRTENTSEPTDERKARIRDHMRIRSTIPKRLQERGYTTIGFTPNPYTSRHYNFDKGFDHFEDFLDSEARNGCSDSSKVCLCPLRELLSTGSSESARSNPGRHLTGT